MKTFWTKQRIVTFFFIAVFILFIFPYPTLSTNVDKQLYEIPLAHDYGFISREYQSEIPLDYDIGIATGLYNVPSSIVNSFKDDGFTVSVSKNQTVNEKLSYEVDFEVCGVFSPRNKTIYLIKSQELRAREYTIAHEFGHYFDRLNGYASLGEKWKAIYQEEKDLFSKYASKNEREFFAEVFADIVTSIKANDKTRAAVEMKSLIHEFENYYKFANAKFMVIFPPIIHEK